MSLPAAALFDHAPAPTGLLALASGDLFYGYGFGAPGETVAELCFNTAQTGYQEIMTDPSYAGQIVTFTMPHIGNTGINDEDDEASGTGAAGMVVRAVPTDPSNWRASRDLIAWLAARGRIGIGGVDTRRLTRAIRAQGAPHAALAYAPDGQFDPEALVAKAREFAGLEGLDLAKDAGCKTAYDWQEKLWHWPGGPAQDATNPDAPHVVAVDFGTKHNILRALADQGMRVTVVPPQSTADEIRALRPDGVFLSNGPGDPAATGAYALPMIRGLLEDKDLPIFGICLGHQLLALALGARTVKMAHGHHGANHPVKDLTTGKVEITSMNHGFAVEGGDALPEGIIETHVSLFDGTNCGLALAGRPVFSVQHHPEASPGPHDSLYLFGKFARSLRSN